jgi:putrescine aminotransferase
MAAAKAAVEAIRDGDAVPAAARIGGHILAAVRRSASTRCRHLVREVRGEGLLIGIEMVDPGMVGELLMELFDRHVLVNHSLNNSAVVRLTPPAILTADEVERLTAVVDAAFESLATRFEEGR